MNIYVSDNIMITKTHQIAQQKTSSNIGPLDV